MDDKALLDTVHRSILEVVQERNPSVVAVSDAQLLHADLGLKSIELARIVAVLELELEVDPFAERVAITDVRSVGDVVAAYRLGVSGEPSGLDAAIEEGRRRAAARRGTDA